MVVDTGLEPATSSMSRKRASQLRQSTVVKRMFSFCLHLPFSTYEVETGFEPVYRDLQSLASPLGHSTGSPNVSTSERMTGFEPATLTLAR